MPDHEINRPEEHPEKNSAQRASDSSGLTVSPQEVRAAREAFNPSKSSEGLSFGYVSTSFLADFAKYEKYAPPGPVPEMDETRKYISQKPMQLSLTA